MPDFSLEELKDMLRTVDMMARIGDLIAGDDVADIEIQPIFTLIPGQMPSMRIPDLRMPLGSRGPHDPNGPIDRVQSGVDVSEIGESLSLLWGEIFSIQKAIAEGRQQDQKDFDQRLVQAETALLALQDRIENLGRLPSLVNSEHPAATSSSLVPGGDVLPDSSQDVGQVTDQDPLLPTRSEPAAAAPLPVVSDDPNCDGQGRVQAAPARGPVKAWSESEDWAIIEAVAAAKVSNTLGAVTQAKRDMAAFLGRTVKAVVLRCGRDLAARIDIRAAQLQAEQQTPSESGEQAGGAAEVVQVPAQVPPADDALTAHLTSPRIRYRKGQPDWAFATDAELMEMVLNNTPAAIIGDQLGLQPHEVTLRFDQLTGYDRETKTRRFNRNDVAARLMALAAAHPAVAA